MSHSVPHSLKVVLLFGAVALLVALPTELWSVSGAIHTIKR